MVYANAFALDLDRNQVSFEREKRIAVTYEGTVVGDYIADFVLQQKIVVELKAVESLTVNHSLQLVNYLAATRFDLGLLLNFGGKSLQFKTKTRLYEQPDILISGPDNGRPGTSQFSNSVNSV